MEGRRTGKLADSFHGALATAISKLDDEAAFHLRSEISAIRAVLAGRKTDTALLTAVDRALDAVGGFHRFAAEVKGFVVSRDVSKTASLYEVGSVGILAVENVLTAERKNLFRILMSGLSGGLAYAASRQYVHGSSAVLDGLYRTHSGQLYDELWSLATEFRGPLDEKAVQEVQTGLDGFFTSLAGRGVTVDTRVTALYQLYAIVLLVRCADLLQKLRAA